MSTLKKIKVKNPWRKSIKSLVVPIIKAKIYLLFTKHTASAKVCKKEYVTNFKIKVPKAISF